MSVFKNFTVEDVEYWHGEWKFEVDEFGEECTFAEFMEGIWECSPFNPESDEYECFIPKMKYNFGNLLTIPRNSGLPTVACRCWWASRVNYHCSKDHKLRLKRWVQSNKRGDLISRNYKCFKY